jgi:hypothetical protein
VRDLAVQNSSALKSKELESIALASEKNLRGKWQNPQLMGQVGSLKSAGQVGSTIEFSLVQAVPLSDKFGLRRELAELALQSYEKEKKYFTQWVEHEALLASWRLLVARELYTHGIERAERIKLIQKYLSTHPRVSIRQKVEQSIIGSLVLSDFNYKLAVVASYMIGFGIYTMLFASHTSLIQNNEIMSVIQMSQQEYHDFSLKNDCFASTFSGAIIQTPEDEAIGLALISNKLFSNFINNEVNIKQILQEGTSVDNLPDYTVLKERMFKLMGEIVVKVNADRGTPIGATALPTDSTALPTTATALPTDSTALPTTATALPTDTTASASGIAGISQEEAAARAARGQQKYEENVAKGLIKPQGIQDTSKLFTYSQGEPGNVVTSTTGTKTRVGGKRSKRYLINKRKTIKKRPNKKTIKNISRKRYRRPRRTRKY